MFNLSFFANSLRALLLLTALSTTALSATTSIQNHIWLRTPGGISEPICRKFWIEYDNTFHTNSIIMSTKYGLDGIIPLTELLASKEKNKYYCGGSSTITTNPIVYSDVDTKADQFNVLAGVAGTPLIWLTPNANKATNFKELIAYWKSLNRPINVGTYFTTAKMIPKHLEALGIPVNLISYKNGAQAYPSLADGTLDLSVDGTAALSVAAGGKFRVVGYNWIDNIPKLSQFPNFSQDDKLIQHLRSGFVIAVPKGSMTKQEEEIMARRFQFIAQSSNFSTFILENQQVPMNYIGDQLKKSLDLEYAVGKKYLK